MSDMQTNEIIDELDNWINRLENLRAIMLRQSKADISALWDEATGRPLFGNTFKMLFEQGYAVHIKCELKLLKDGEQVSHE
jgi:hypothetical protein